MCTSKVIKTIPEKCVNCHRCISVCPSKLCNDGSGDYVKAVFDVSFGAELTTKSYVEYIKTNPKLVISQPCPALVSYIELYQSDLLPYLSPADSPMAHTFAL